jgi:hypothetical protein
MLEVAGFPPDETSCCRLILKALDFGLLEALHLEVKTVPKNFRNAKLYHRCTKNPALWPFWDFVTFSFSISYSFQKIENRLTPAASTIISFIINCLRTHFNFVQ